MTHGGLWEKVDTTIIVSMLTDSVGPNSQSRSGRGVGAPSWCAAAVPTTRLYGWHSYIWSAFL